MKTRRESPLLRAYTILYILFLYFPIFILILFSFNSSIYVAFPLKGFTLSWYGQMLSNGALIGALQNSLIVGAVVACLSTVIGTMAAKAFIQSPRMPGRRAMMVIGMAPLVVPALILGVSLLSLFSAVGAPLSLYGIAVAHIVVCTPFSMMVMISRLEGLDRSIEEAASDLGETPWMTFWRVTFPLIFPGLVASLLLTFTISFDEFVLAFFLSGNETTLPVYIWGQLRFPRNIPSMLALSAAILIVSFVTVSFSEWFRRRGLPQ